MSGATTVGSIAVKMPKKETPAKDSQVMWKYVALAVRRSTPHANGIGSLTYMNYGLFPANIHAAGST